MYVNLVEGGSKYFGVDPIWAYVGKYFWAQYNVMYPFVAYSVYFYWYETRKKGGSPEMAYMILFYLLIFSLIPHKEKRFMLAITAFTYLTLGYMLVRKIKVWKSWVATIVWTGVLVEIAIQAVYHIHHKLWVVSDYIMAQG